MFTYDGNPPVGGTPSKEKAPNILPFSIISRWKLLINENLFSQAQEIKNNCDYFYFDHPGGWWYDQIEAINKSSMTN